MSPNYSLEGVVSGNHALAFKEFATTFGGRVEFDYGEVTFPNIGTVRIKGEVPRILPRKRIVPISVAEFDSIHNKLKVWKNQYWPEKSPKWEDLTEVTILHGYATASPFFAIDSTEMHLLTCFTLWLWHVDDILEQAAEIGLTSTDVDEAIEQFISIAEGKEVSAPRAQKFPEFQIFFDAISNVIEEITKIVPNYQDICEPFVTCLHKFLDTSAWYLSDVINHRYSQETFIYWRRRSSFWAGTAEFIFILLGKSLPNNIRHSSTFGRVTDITDSMGGFTNDVLGLRKELPKGEIDNFVVFKILEKGIPVANAVQETCDLIKGELSDLLLLRTVLLQRFLNNPTLILYMDIVETIIDGFAIVHANSKRHLGRGFINMVWDIQFPEESSQNLLG